MSQSDVFPPEFYYNLSQRNALFFFFVKTLWNILCPLVTPTDCQASVQVVQVCIQPLPKPGLDKVTEQPKALTHSSLALSSAVMLASARVNHRWCKEQTHSVNRGNLITRYPFYSCTPAIKIKQREIKLICK